MNVLILGSGGREHALAWKLARSPRAPRVLAAPGSDGIAREATCFPDVAAGDADAVVALARREGVDLVVVGPEDPLAAGIADRLRAAGVAVFGPSAAAAQLEGSKTFAKEFMRRHAIPTAGFAFFDDLGAARAHVRALRGPCVVKADGLAAGKGVAVCDGAADAERALGEIMGARRFGAAGARVVIEERLVGQEVSYYAISDGTHVVPLAGAQDHKRALDGDRGENTGGMGAYSPAPVFTPAIEKRVLEEIVHPAIRGMAAEGHPFQGVLFAGLMIEPSGAPKVIEFNVRFGDPETQPLLLRMDGDLLALLDAAARGRLDGVAAPEWHGAAVCVVLASGGYPRGYATGKPITGIDEAERDPDVIVFHAGTQRDASGGFASAGGRVLGVTARGASVAEAQRRAYAACDRIAFEGMHLRRDIAARAIA
ncbi:MAG: phosphoribosylamine--glycine ligase [Proteobacteria bacterium]|nr:MAG: phosphoribosylamine--glycine ligase [Pseudomonadota bacterium]